MYPRLIRGTLNKVNKRVKKEIKRLCRNLAYAVAAYLCPAVRKRERVDALGGFRRRRHIEKEPAIKIKRTDAAKMLVERLRFFNRMIGSAPVTARHPVPAEEGIEVFIYKLKEQEYCIRLTDVKKRCPSPDRGSKRPHRSGLELIRLTLNLARGDLEQNARFTAAPAG